MWCHLAILCSIARPTATFDLGWFDNLPDSIISTELFALVLSEKNIACKVEYTARAQGDHSPSLSTL